jgi:hypothetical protein
MPRLKPIVGAIFDLLGGGIRGPIGGVVNHPYVKKARDAGVNGKAATRRRRQIAEGKLKP